MILFADDFKRFPTAIIDYDTSNESFLRLAALYRKMQVRNSAFLLALMQPELKGVDPHALDLTDEQKVMIAMECKYNPWYYFREVVRIPPTAGPNPVPFLANRGNIAMIWCFLCSIDIALIQPRQTGKSVSTDTLMTMLMFITLSNTTINLITKDDVLRRKNIESLKEIRDLLPPYLVNRSGRDSDNQIELTCNALGNQYRTGVSQGSERAANNLGRGMTVSINHIDEGPFINFIGITLPAALASGNAARDEAKRNGAPYGNIFTTTAGKKDDRDGRFMYEFIHAGAPWNEAFLDARSKGHLEQLVKTNCSGRKVLVNATFSHKQLGKTDEWLYEKITSSGASGEAADRDFFNVWTSGTQSSPLSTKLNETIRNSEMDPLHNEITRDNYIVRWYLPEEEIERTMAESRFVMGLDTSEAVGRDSIGLVIVDVKDLSVVAAATLNETNLIRFAKFLGDLLIRYPNVTLIPERKSTGQMVVDSLLVLLPKHGIDPFRRIYNVIVDESEERREEYKAVCADINRRPNWIYDKYKKYFGFNTTGSSRNTLYSTVLQNAAKKSGHLVRDKVLSGEIRGLVVKKGRIDHEASGHDDMVIAWLLTEWMLTHSKNLGFYGIDTTKVLTNKHLGDREEISPLEEYNRSLQEELNAEIESVYEQLKDARDDFQIAKLEHRLRVLNSRVVDSDTDALSIDALIQNARETRNREARAISKNKSMLDPRSIWTNRFY